MTQEVHPERITKPMQLLAAWLAGLVIIDTAFLASAKVLTSPPWLPVVLTGAAVLNVPLFLVCFFLLQTRFRPEMQEDTYYSQYLQSRQTSTPLNVITELAIFRHEAVQAGRVALELVEGVQKQNEMMASQLNQLGAAQLLPLSDESLSVAVENVRINTMSRLNEARSDLQWAQARVAVNDLLPDYVDIRDRFKRSNIPIRNTFGSTSSPPLVPSIFLLSAGPGVPVERFQLVLRACGESMQYVQLSTAIDEGGQIFVGSYGYEGAETRSRIVKLTPDVRAWLLQPGVSLVDFLRTFQGS